MMSNQVAHFTALPKKTLMDETVEITVSDLTPGHTVTIIAITINKEDGVVFYSFGEYHADWNGVLDVNRSFSYKGTYVGIESMGLFWSAISAPGQKKGLRLMKRVVDSPLNWFLFLVDGTVYDGLVEILVDQVRDTYKSEEISPKMKNSDESKIIISLNELNNVPIMIKDRKYNVLATTSVQRYYCYPEVVSQIPIRDGRLRGILFVPNQFNKSDEPKIGLIDIYGGGSFECRRAALLASRGYVVFALAYCDYDDISSEIDIDVNYLKDAADFMFSPRCPVRIFEGGLGAIGLCKGATMALELAAHHPKVKNVVAIGASCYNQLGSFRRSDSDEDISHSWDMNSPFLRRSDEGVIAEGLFEWFDQMSPERKHKIGVPVEKISSILFIYGEDDACIGIHNLNYFLDRLKNANKSNFRCLVYPCSGHIIDPPIYPLSDSFYWPSFKDIFVFGGESRHHHHAQVDSWNHILKYFKSMLNDNVNAN